MDILSMDKDARRFMLRSWIMNNDFFLRFQNELSESDIDVIIENVYNSMPDGKKEELTCMKEHFDAHLNFLVDIWRSKNYG